LVYTSPMRRWTALILAAATIGCSDVKTAISANGMRGFSPVEACAIVQAESLDACSVRTGELVVEVVDAIVREWPVEPGGSLEKKKQPLLLTELDGPGQGTGTKELIPLVAPEGYAQGERLRFFAGRRLLQRPLRHLAGRTLTIRLAKNNRTAEPIWEAYAQKASRYTLGAVSAVGLPSVPPEAMDVGFEIVRRLTPDDRILEWTTPIDTLIGELGQREQKRAVRVRLSTTRRFGGEASADLFLVVYVEPEVDCH
jgi:hypothetical protein